MGRVPKPCLDCGALTTSGSRCAPHQRQHDAPRNARKNKRYNRAWEAHSKRARAEHVAAFGPVCPGWRTERHVVAESELVVDHDLGVMCRICNSRKAALFDRPNL